VDGTVIELCSWRSVVLSTLEPVGSAACCFATYEILIVVVLVISMVLKRSHQFEGSVNVIFVLHFTCRQYKLVMQIYN
jgi:hypothetical protein